MWLTGFLITQKPIKVTLLNPKTPQDPKDFPRNPKTGLKASRTCQSNLKRTNTPEQSIKASWSVLKVNPTNPREYQGNPREYQGKPQRLSEGIDRSRWPTLSNPRVTFKEPKGNRRETPETLMDNQL